MHMEMESNEYNIDEYTLLVLDRALYIDYIALAIVPSWGAGEPAGAMGWRAHGEGPGPAHIDRQSIGQATGNQ